MSPNGYTQQYHVLFVDNDRCALSERKVGDTTVHEFTNPNISSLRALAAYLNIVPASGRPASSTLGPYMTAFRNYPDCKFNIEFLVHHNGAGVSRVDRDFRITPTEHIRLLDGRIAQEIDAFVEKEFPDAVLFKIFYDNAQYRKRSNKELVRVYDNRNPELKFDDVSRLSDGKAHKVIVLLGKKEDPKAKDYRDDLFEHLKREYGSSGEVIKYMETYGNTIQVEIIDHDAGKLPAAEFVIDKINVKRRRERLEEITLKNSFAIGDAPNDIELLDKVGIGVAVANAPSEVKRATVRPWAPDGFVTRADYNNDAIFEATGKFFTQEKIFRRGVRAGQ